LQDFVQVFSVPILIDFAEFWTANSRHFKMTTTMMMLLLMMLLLMMMLLLLLMMMMMIFT